MAFDQTPDSGTVQARSENGSIKNNIEDPVSQQICINAILTDDCLRAVLSKLKPQSEKDNFSLVCKRWLMVQSSERRRIAARAGPLMLQKLAVRFQSLLELDFAQSISRSFYPGVIDADLETIASHFRILEQINLQECKGITDKGVAALAKGIPGLKCVLLSHCKKVSNKGIEALANSCSRLHHLDVARCKLVSDKALEALARSCRDLDFLDVSGCFNITDQGLQALANGCCKLQSLNLGSCFKVGDAGVISLASSNPFLSFVSLQYCSKLTDDSITFLARHCGNLHTLLLESCGRLTNASLQAVAKECGGKLRNLQLSWCCELTDEAAISIFSHCKALKSLRLDGCNITDYALEALEIHGGQLRELSLTSCLSISDAGILKIAVFCRRLEVLEIRQCAEVAYRGLVAAKFPPGCKITI